MPNDTITREEAITMISRVLGEKWDTGEDVEFSDTVDISDYAIEAVE